MSVKINNLLKVYGSQRAVDGLTFTAEKGAILGFLGPNGAGKSTTMKIATGYLSPTAGSIQVDGIDIEENPLEAQRIIGYLPEHNPLYLDLYVREFLEFSGRLNKVGGSTLRKSVDEKIEMCGLVPERHKKIGQLSKGYRQRVGLAQALLHDPAVLILDEPTSGLDPNQILEIRKLIKEVSQDKTVIFSTHIMQEVQALCDRVVLINKGKKIADKSIAEFSKGLGSDQSLRVEFKERIDAQLLESLDSVLSVEVAEDMTYLVKVEDSDAARSDVFRLAAEHNLPLVGLQEEKGSLEEVFQSLTQSQA